MTEQHTAFMYILLYQQYGQPIGTMREQLIIHLPDPLKAIKYGKASWIVDALIKKVVSLAA